MYLLCSKSGKYKGIPDAVFIDHSAGEQFFNDMPETIRAKYEPVTLDLDFPFYFLWTWDIHDHSNRDKYKVYLVNANGVDDYVKTIKRDKKWEEENQDDQYFYLGIIWNEGISYGLRLDLKMPIEPYEIHEMFDHDHVIGDVLEDLKSRGVKRALLNRGMGLSLYRRFKRRNKIRRKLIGKSLSDGGKKKLRRLDNWLSKRTSKLKTVYG